MADVCKGNVPNKYLSFTGETDNLNLRPSLSVKSATDLALWESYV